MKESPVDAVLAQVRSNASQQAVNAGRDRLDIEVLADEVERLRRIIAETKAVYIESGLHQAFHVLSGAIRNNPEGPRHE